MARQRYQKGAVYLRGKKGVWHGRWREDVMNAAGEVRRVRKSMVLGSKAELPTEKLAQRRLDLVLARINAPSYRPGRTATVAEFAERWQATVLIQQKPESQRVAKIHLNKYILPRLGQFMLDQIGREMQQGFLTWISQRASRKYVLNIIGTLGAMLNTAASWGYICEKLETRTLVFPREAVRKEARYFTVEQTQQIIAAAAEPWRTLFLLAVTTGLRAGELCGLQVGDLDFGRKLLHVRRSVCRGQVQTPKSAYSMRPLPMPVMLEAALRVHVERQKLSGEGWLFANRFGGPQDGDRIVRKQLYPLLDALGIARCGLHAFRHTHASLLVDTLAPQTVARDQMRHSDVSTTMALYAHTLGDAQRQAVERVALVLDADGRKRQTSGQWLQ